MCGPFYSFLELYAILEASELIPIIYAVWHDPSLKWSFNWSQSPAPAPFSPAIAVWQEPSLKWSLVWSQSPAPLPEANTEPAETSIDPIKTKVNMNLFINTTPSIIYLGFNRIVINFTYFLTSSSTLNSSGQYTFGAAAPLYCRFSQLNNWFYLPKSSGY